MKVTRCRHCNKPVALNKTAWTCGPIFCSHECGVEWAKTKYESNEYADETELTDKATAYFNDIAEEINREDYGARTELFPMYQGEHDMTVLFENVYEGDDIISQTLVGWHYGEPDLKHVNSIIESGMTAIFVE